MTAPTLKAPKITYSGIGGNLDEIDRGFEDALERVKAGFGAKHYSTVAGNEVRGGGSVVESHSPIDRTMHVGTFVSASNDEVQAAVDAARAAAPVWRGTPWNERVAIMREIAETIRERKFELAAIMSVEVGKTRFEALGDAEEAADLVDYYADQVENAAGFVQPLAQLSPNEKTQDILRPYGVFAVISPFNFPMALATGMSSAALLAGNTVVLKPAENVSLTGSKLAEIFNASRLPKGAFNILYGPGESVGKALTENSGIDGIAFTGSFEVGKHLHNKFGAAGKHAKPVLAELGGKNATIVSANADLEAAAEGVMRSAFGLQGQKCSACSRVYVDRSVAQRFMDLLVEKSKALVVGDPTQRGVYIGPVIDEGAVKRFENAVQRAKRDGSLILGGERLTNAPLDRGNYVTPTIVQLPLDHALFREELFLPFLAVGIVDSFDAGLREANRSDYGLTAGLFSTDEREVERFFDEIEAGVVYVNRKVGATTGAWPGVQSFCGWKGSGITGKGGCGPYYVTQFLREQSRTRVV
ncbi:MAG TPA: aldehyde dehydrogenase family protein [Candidatus Tumulicola sp.]